MANPAIEELESDRLATVQGGQAVQVAKWFQRMGGSPFFLKVAENLEQGPIGRNLSEAQKAAQAKLKQTLSDARWKRMNPDEGGTHWFSPDWYENALGFIQHP